MWHVVYVGRTKEAKRNLDIGLARGIWGLRPYPYNNSSRPQVGDHMLFVRYGPDPRRPDLWGTAHFQELHVSRVVRPFYRDTSSVWPDDVYRQRLDLEIVSSMVADHREFEGSALIGTDAVEAARYSANVRGAIKPLPASYSPPNALGVGATVSAPGGQPPGRDEAWLAAYERARQLLERSSIENLAALSQLLGDESRPGDGPGDTAETSTSQPEKGQG